MKIRRSNMGMLFILFIIMASCTSKEKESSVPEKQTKTTEFDTYCNPVDIDYSYMSHYAYRGVSYRSGADPAVINYKGKYYMFVTRSHGYWVSDDMSNWKFIKPQSWYFNGSNAPAAAVLNDEIIVLGDPSGHGAVIKTNNPELGNWQTTYSVIPISIQDPDLFVDDDGKVYLYEESSNLYPLRVVELDPNNHFVPKGEQQDLFKLHPDEHGWERFGQDHKSDIDPYLEGPWMSKHNGKYYLEYSAPGTQWNVYADGVYTSDNPLGPFEYAPYNPISYKPGGFLTGAGHGSTVKDNQGHYWHFASMPISVNYKFERRIGMFPAGFEGEQMYVNTAYGDYPHYLPHVELEDNKNRFTGWMLLTYKKPATSNSTISGVERKVVDESDTGFMLEQEEPDYSAAMVTDENIRTYWVAANSSDSLYLQVDLEKEMTVNAVQLNFQDFNSNIFGRPDTLKYQFTIDYSTDGKNWSTMIDYSKNERDQPHAYIELEEPVEARYVRYNNIHIPHQYLAISDFRVFGKGHEAVPVTPANFKANRQEDRRNTDLTWEPSDSAIGYVVYWGISKDRLNNSVMIYEKNAYELRALNIDQKYYYQVEAFSENGVSEKSPILETE
ncbi:family 43 glycosylhydrolase [Fulvivirga maritima]|uniref:family 43 glycosylhydrolase n=1 Tax=Fulvivirga maritima TaxID=2904247 RepID=UPI001F28D00B|nr:family 43 glycosylhydrolase [Fulvivirga maritima]UII29374.1 family 43 glycosylhydrolase [Fulvivirga maritima]